MAYPEAKIQNSGHPTTGYTLSQIADWSQENPFQQLAVSLTGSPPDPAEYRWNWAEEELIAAAGGPIRADGPGSNPPLLSAELARWAASWIVRVTRSRLLLAKPESGAPPLMDRVHAIEDFAAAMRKWEQDNGIEG